MSEISWTALRQLFVSGYDDLNQRLARRLGSAELAADAMQDTYFRLQRTGSAGVVQNPLAYLYRTAVNTAINRRVAERRHAATFDVDAALRIVDETPGPEQRAISRSDIRILQRALAELSERRRAVFIAGFLEDVPHAEIAQRLDVSLRTVVADLRFALDHCVKKLREGGG